MKEQIEAQISEMQKQLAHQESILEVCNNTVESMRNRLDDEEINLKGISAKCDRLRAIIGLLESHLPSEQLFAGSRSLTDQENEAMDKAYQRSLKSSPTLPNRK